MRESPPLARRQNLARLRGPRQRPVDEGRLAVDRRHGLSVIALARSRAGRQDPVEAVDLFLRQFDVERDDILVEIAPMFGTGDGHHVVALGEHPGERELSGGATLFPRHRLDLVDELDVLLEILALEARVVLAEIALAEIARRLDLPSEETAPERRISDIGDAELANRRQHLGFGVAAP